VHYNRPNKPQSCMLWDSIENNTEPQCHSTYPVMWNLQTEQHSLTSNEKEIMADRCSSSSMSLIFCFCGFRNRGVALPKSHRTYVPLSSIKIFSTCKHIKTNILCIIKDNVTVTLVLVTSETATQWYYAKFRSSTLTPKSTLTVTKFALQLSAAYRYH